MLKITRDVAAGKQRWHFCGQLTGPWVSEARSAWEHARGESEHGAVVVDLSDVTSVDESGESLLRAMKADGVRFVARGVDMRHMLSQLRGKARPALRRWLAHMDRDCF
jgi:hypothetical protein